MPLKSNANLNSELVLDLSGIPLAKTLFRMGLTMDLILLALDLIFNYARVIDVLPLRRLFNIAREDGIGTYFASFQTLCVGAVLGLLWVQARLQQCAAGQVRGWGFLSLFFFYMAFDDAAELHERFGYILKAILKSLQSEPHPISKTLEQFPSYPWHLLLGPVLFVILIMMILFIYRQVQTAQVRYILFGALMLYVAAVGLDFLEGLDGFFNSIAEALSVRKYTVSHLFKAAEEFMELLGGTLFLTGFISVFISRGRSFKIVLREP